MRQYLDGDKNMPNIFEGKEFSAARFGNKFGISLDSIKSNISNGVANISAACWLGSSSPTKLGYLISRLINQYSNRSEKWSTLFTNSALESLYAVIRISRQIAHRDGREKAKKVLILDERGQYRPFFDPRGAGEDAALCPGVFFSESVEDLTRKINFFTDQIACVIIIEYNRDIPESLWTHVDDVCRSVNAIRVVCKTEIPINDSSLFQANSCSDIVIFGENLTNNEVPFGAFSLNEKLYSSWGDGRSLLTYTSTFAGNATSTSTALTAICAYKDYFIDMDKQIFRQIDNNFEDRLKYFGNHVHSAFIERFFNEKKELKIVSAQGVNLTLENGKNIIDTSSLGCSLRGHNPDGFIDRVINRFDPDRDYLKLLEEKVSGLTRFSHAFPSVSGAGAVDNSIILALLANPDRQKIICFKGNFSGKTLTSSNFSKSAVLLADINAAEFDPYYPHVITINPFASDAEEQFQAALAEGDVALVWFEIVQGYMVRKLPENLMSLIDGLKSDYHYLIGIDEVLTGMWKSGRSMLYQQEYVPNADIVSLSKSTSDMIFPVSFSLVTDAVYNSAVKTGEYMVNYLKRFYKNNFGACVALNAINVTDDFYRENFVLDKVNRFFSEVNDCIKDSTLFDGITTEGILLRFNINRDWFPYEEGSYQSALIEGAVSKMIFNATGVLLTNLRMFLPVIHDESLHFEILKRLKSGIGKIKPSDVYVYLLCENYSMLDQLGMKNKIKEVILEKSA